MFYEIIRKKNKIKRKPRAQSPWYRSVKHVNTLIHYLINEV